VKSEPLLEAAAEGDENERLSGLLKRCRARIPPGSPSLGRYLRLPNRVGKPITQEEVAEAVGISRQWYLTMETDRAVRVSASVLARVADVLMMTPAERAALFGLGVPELPRSSLTPQSIAILDAFGSLRRLTRRLWVATTEAETLAVVREYGATQLAPDRMQTLTRVAEGRWDRASTGDAELPQRYDLLRKNSMGKGDADDLCCYTLMALPGELITRAERDARFPDLAAKERPLLKALGLPDLSFAMASIRSRRGFVARLLSVHHRPHAYSEIDRAQLSTLAELASLALSG
jgi:transcriptional regulator with XRE-family HTH domain